MKRIFPLIIAGCFANMLQGQPKNNNMLNLLIGTYTTSVTSDGIYCYAFNNQTGDVILKSAISGVENPSYLAVSHDGNHESLTKQPLSPAEQDSVAVKPGSGPRHLTFHPDSKTAYLGI